jgi:hypothetical protein
MGAQPADTNVLNSSRHRLWGVICVFLISMSTAIASGALYQSWSLARERPACPRPGRLVDVDGRKMHFYCTGHGTPVVMLDSGLGDLAESPARNRDIRRSVFLRPRGYGL